MNKKTFASLLLAVAFVSACAARVLAATAANSPDDICPPTADPCEITQNYEVTAPGGTLDFGLRAVRITPTGRLERSANIFCGAFIAEGGKGHVATNSSDGPRLAGSLSVTARRACSGDGTTPCLDDSLCASLSLGTCSVGDGTISYDAKHKGNGGPGGSFILLAAGDITVDGLINVNSNVRGTDGGLVQIESMMGSVTVGADVLARAGAPATQYGTPDSAGTVMLRAALDVTVKGKLDQGGGASGGLAQIDAGRDAFILAGITVSAGGLPYASGGSIEVDAGRNVVVDSQPGEGAMWLKLNGGAAKYGGDEYYPGKFYGGAGGYCRIAAGGDLTVSNAVTIEAKGSRKAYIEGYPYGGDIALSAGGVASVAGHLASKGYGSFGQSRTLSVHGAGGVTLDRGAVLDARSKFSGGSVIVGSDGPVEFDGKIDVRADLFLTPKPSYYGYTYFEYGYGGSVYIEGKADVTIGGRIFGAANGGSAGVHIDVCRLTIESGGRIDQTHGTPDGADDDNLITVRESMRVDPDGVLVTKASTGVNRITYRDPAKPPVLLGHVSPAPQLIVDPSLAGCPVCGNLEIDQGESCDDGNQVSGDGCRDDCQDEGCIAQTPPPGYPTVPLCFDGDACTLDVCDAVTHTCSNVLSCEEGVACTVDECVAGACQHTADDSLCDDGDDCSIDVCNPTTGCTYADAPDATPCEDGDPCTLTGSCANGNCAATDERRTHTNKIVVRLRDGAADDRFSFRALIPDPLFGSDPTVTGVIFELRDETRQVVYSASIPASAFELRSGRYFFRDLRHEVPSANGMVSLALIPKTSKAITVVRAKMKDTEVPGAAMQQLLSATLLFGSDPATDDCVSAWQIPCQSRPGKTACKD